MKQQLILDGMIVKYEDLTAQARGTKTMFKITVMQAAGRIETTGHLEITVPKTLLEKVQLSALMKITVEYETTEA